MAASETDLIVMTRLEIEQKVNRIARQLHENFFEEDSIILVGIAKRGLEVAERINKVLSGISDNEVVLASLEINKQDPLGSDPKLSVDPESIRDKVIVLIDDVLNSGHTLIYACRFLLGFEPKRMNTAVLVDRRHRKFPIRADFVGLTLSTTLEEHINVDMEANQVYLS